MINYWFKGIQRGRAEDMVIGHVILVTIVIELDVGLPVVGRVDVDTAIEDVCRRVGSIDVGDDRGHCYSDTLSSRPSLNKRCSSSTGYDISNARSRRQMRIIEATMKAGQGRRGGAASKGYYIRQCNPHALDHSQASLQQAPLKRAKALRTPHTTREEN